LLDDFANLVNDYKTKHEMSISSIMRRLEMIASIFLVDIIVLVLSLKKRDQSPKTIENALISKKRDRLPKVKATTNSKKDNDVKTLS